MKIHLKLGVVIFLFFSILSCSSESNVDSNDSIDYDNQKRSYCQDQQVDRMAINEDYSMIVVHCYDQGALIDVSYEVSDRQVNDKISALDLSGGVNSLVAHVFNEKIDNLNYSGNLYSSINPSGEGEDYCECKDAKPPAVDCKLEEYRKIKSCDSNFCDACSLVMVFSLDSGETQKVSTSVVFLPYNS